MKIETLKPCPFCGGEASLKEKSGYDYGSHIHRVECLDCGVKTFEKSSGADKKSLTRASAVYHVKKNHGIGGFQYDNQMQRPDWAHLRA